MTAPVLVVQHEDGCPPAWFGTWMTASGAALDVRRPYVGEVLPVDLSEHSGLLVLGGAMNATDEVATPWLVPTKALVREAVAHETPVLGICLGHQIVSDALGGTVEPNPNGTQRDLLEHGWTESAADDPLFGSRPARAAHWNNDVVTEPPPGATVLARASGGEVQALRFGVRAWGIQSHPEVDEQVLALWAEEDGVDVAGFLAAVAAARADLDASWQPVAVAFATLCSENPYRLRHG
ncbi:type 1 glutamine amidotransferase [Nocardioides marmorisolisilvae]|uniref:Type 1 glutamine amidotransferase n=1 Tax=Nocardioides marmorisolisilvae TaxID=1542737 RepID=A0A3N0DTJ5_9ACTN|nr:type 1 glutamine amidotransferase [Nocardioides marmorisolisilvae]RNL78949.1 type 1 glutamine amidotransferase [Nocardioides marmorisolisilvae]